MKGTVRLVVLELREAIGPEIKRRYRATADRLAQVAQRDVSTVHYTDLNRKKDGAALVLSGSWEPWSSHDPAELARFDEFVRECDGPIFGICAGMQTLARAMGGDIGLADQATGPGFRPVEIADDSDLFQGLAPQIHVFQHHQEEVLRLPDGFRLLACSDTCGVEALAARDRAWWGTQFHPEEWSSHHPAGRAVLENFFRLAGLTPESSPRT